MMKEIVMFNILRVAGPVLVSLLGVGLAASTLPRTAFAAIAASTADPPLAKISAPATDACTWLVATMP